MKLENIKNLVACGKVKLISSAITEALDEGCDAEDLLNSMISAMDVVGERFRDGEIFVPEMLVAAKAMKKGVELLKPHLTSGATSALGKVAIGTVAGDLHDIGKNLVIMMIESAGYEVEDLGIDVPIQTFLDAANDPAVSVVGASALLTTTMPAMQETVAALNNHPRRNEFKIMVGGAPITQMFADEIGADIYTADAASAAKKVKELI